MLLEVRHHHHLWFPDASSTLEVVLTLGLGGYEGAANSILYLFFPYTPIPVYDSILAVVLNKVPDDSNQREVTPKTPSKECQTRLQ